MVSNISPSSSYKSAVDGKYQVKVDSSFIIYEADYTFYLLTLCNGGYNYWASNSTTLSYVMKLKVYCGPNSGSIT